MCFSRWFTAPGGAQRKAAADLLQQQQALAAAAAVAPEDSEQARLTGEQRLRKQAMSKGFSASFFAPRGGGAAPVASKMLFGQ